MDPLFIHESVIFLDPNPKYKGAETGLHGAPRVGSAAGKFRFTLLCDECILMCSAVSIAWYCYLKICTLCRIHWYFTHRSTITT
jgi:hypothetical protein